MTPEDEEFLTDLYRNLNKQAIPPTSPQYVPLEELPGQVMGPDTVKLLGRTITMTTPGEFFPHRTAWFWQDGAVAAAEAESVAARVRGGHVQRRGLPEHA
jgi:hypothetical protein